MWMRGGTSKGAFFLKEDLPADADERNAFLLRVMGSPDTRQIDGMGGGDPLTSKVAVVSKSSRPCADVDYLFLQVFVDQALVSDQQKGGTAAGKAMAMTCVRLLKAWRHLAAQSGREITCGGVADRSGKKNADQIDSHGKQRVVGRAAAKGVGVSRRRRLVVAGDAAQVPEAHQGELFGMVDHALDELLARDDHAALHRGGGARGGARDDRGGRALRVGGPLETGGAARGEPPQRE